ncbi:SH3 and cysteine-rich domain-containing protein 2-like isoform X1 [Colius striatus]|uniref:SH3 and cysteine-rich domain-containing protein 2-like isoform X1 n=1 Tax=Colius striatus TaxID=57412 RepID=UPI002B1E2CCF|nr:SH3 and cysteine-rich domain-containing protein 2-like isoform X1 [Colius striatus]
MQRLEAVPVPPDAAVEQERGEPLPVGGGGVCRAPFPPQTHGFQQYVFKKHCPCELCRQLIAGPAVQGRRASLVLGGDFAPAVPRKDDPDKSVDSVYEALQFSTSLAHGTSPTKLTTGIQRVHPGESMWRSCQAMPGNREQGRISLRLNQLRQNAMPRAQPGQCISATCPREPRASWLVSEMV